MSSRQTTPDILGSLMSGPILKEESNKEIKLSKNKAIEQSGGRTIVVSVKEENKVGENVLEKKEVEELKEKTTFNLSVSLVRELEDKWMAIRKLTGSKQVSKTLIVEKALEIAFAEFDSIKQESQFYGKIASNKDVKQ